MPILSYLGNLGMGGGAAPEAAVEGGGAGGGIIAWDYKPPYYKWWKKEQAKKFRKQKEEANKKIVQLERRTEVAREKVDHSRTIEAIKSALEALARLETALQAERDHLAEVEMEEFAVVWSIYGHSLYIQ